MTRELVTVTLVGGVAYWLLSDRSKSNTLSGAEPNMDLVTSAGGKVMTTAIAEIEVFNDAVTPRFDTLYWVKDGAQERYLLKMYQSVIVSGAPVSGKWVDCVIGTPVVIPLIGSTGKPGPKGEPGDTVVKRLERPNFNLSVIAATATEVVANGPIISQGANESIVIDVLLTALMTNVAGEILVRVMSGAVVVATFAFAINASLTGVQFGRAQVRVPSIGASRDLTVRLSSKYGSASMVGASYVTL